MKNTSKKLNPDEQRWGTKRVRPGERVSTALSVSETFLGTSIKIPIHVWRALEPGPTVLITAAVHGDEINGTGSIRQLLVDPPFELARGTLVLAPAINVPGFVRHERYMPDRRDLNRSFPGSRSGSTTSRLARVVFDKLVKRSDYGVDLHTAAVRRTNYPNIRADLSVPEALRIARAFGAEVLLDGIGPDGSLRREATRAGCPTIILEAGEVWKVEPGVVEYTLRGIRNVLIELGMVEGEPERGAFRVIAKSTKWVRAQCGGFLQFHVAPGELVEEGTPLATSTTLVGTELEIITAPVAGLVIGLTTSPAVAPGDPVAHIAIPDEQQLDAIERALDDLDEDSLASRMRGDLASTVTMTEPRVEDDLVEPPLTEAEDETP